MKECRGELIGQGEFSMFAFAGILLDIEELSQKIPRSHRYRFLRCRHYSGKFVR